MLNTILYFIVERIIPTIVESVFAGTAISALLLAVRRVQIAFGVKDKTTDRFHIVE